MPTFDAFPMDEAAPPTDPTLHDAHVVAAVRAGDRERYRELVERHADRVYAVAWSRLGDASLAEEAAQEAFITAFRRLAWLKQAERFGGWIVTITRHAAINLGLRHRRELRRRERWQLEQAEHGEGGTALAEAGGIRSADSGEARSEEDSRAERLDTLRTSLAELPAAHREALVLFYLEGKSVAEASTVVGVSEGAFKVRLHRARQALRERLEEKLAAGLAQLRAPTRMVRAVMVALPSSTQAAGWGSAGIASLLAKVFPGGFVMGLIPFAAMVPGALLAGWMGRLEAKNFREPTGFRAQVYRRVVVRILFMILAFAVLMPVATAGLGVRGFALASGAVLLVVVGDQLWRTWRFRDRTAFSMAAVTGLLVVGLVGAGVLGWPVWVLNLLQIAFFVGMSFLVSSAPPRMDLSLFVRAQNALLPVAAVDRDPPPTPPAGEDAWRRTAWALARFLGGERVVEDWRWERSALWLRLARVTPSMLGSMIPFYWGSASRLRVGRDGRVEARVGKADRRDLKVGSEAAVAELEQRVAQAVSACWGAAQRGDLPEARRCLGTQSETEIFARPFARSPVTRTRVWVLRGASVFLLVMLIVQQRWMNTSSEVHQARWMVPARVEEAQVRAFLDALAPTAAPPVHEAAWKTWQTVLGLTSHLPPRRYFTEASRQQAVMPFTDFLQRFGNTGPMAWLAALFDDQGRLKLLNSDLLSAEDLTALGVTGARLRQELRALREANLGEAWLRWTRLEEGRGRWGAGDETCRFLLGNLLVSRLQLLQRLDCLDLVDFTDTVKQLKATQVIATNSLKGLWPPAREQRDLLHGLFVLRPGDALRDTRDALTILHLAGALDQIDREACIAGLQRLHDGAGRFAPARTVRGLQVRGEPDNAFAAYESLRLLGALDRVPDLAQWEFRLAPTMRTVEADRNAGKLNYAEVEAWVLGRRFRGEGLKW